MQTQAEIDTHYGPGGPVAAARRWLTAVLTDRDLRAAWRLTDPDWRRELAEAWLAANAAHPLVARYRSATTASKLAQAHGHDPLWRAFAATQLREFTHQWGAVDLETWEWASRPRPYAPGYEIALLVEALDVPEERPVRALPLIMRHVPGVGWRMAGVDRRTTGLG
jgi:hypothetical protein